MSDKRRPTGLWWVGAAAGALLVGSQLLLPVDSPAWDAAYVLCTLGATAVIAVSAWRTTTPVRWVWWCLAGYAGLSLVGDLWYLAIERASGDVPYPGWPDLPYLASYVMAIAGLVILAHRLSPGRDVDTWIDTGILTIAATSVVAVAVLVPMATDLPAWDPTAVMTILYPLADVLVLAALLRIVLGGDRLGAPAALVVGAFTAVLAADLLYNVEVVYGGTDVVAAVYQALYLLGYVLLAAAAALPTAGSLGGGPRPTGRATTTFRTGLLAVGVLTTPVVALIVIWPDNRPLERVLAVLTVAAILLAVVRIRLLLAVVDRQARQLRRQARTDALTGLPNRRTWDFEVDRAVQEARTAGTALTLVMLDLDHFKAFNDGLGHLSGDAFLRAAAGAWDAELPERAFLARYGGEEFALLLPGVDAARAAPLLETIRTATPLGCSVSIGYAELAEGESVPEAMLRADVALFAAKEAGRDRVMRAADPGAEAQRSVE